MSGKELVGALVTGGVRQYGLWRVRPAEVNPLDEYSGVRRAARSTRLKEWVGFLVTHPDLWMSMIVQDAKVLTSSEVILFDPSASTLHHRNAVAPGRAARLPREFFGHRSGLTRQSFDVGYVFGNEGRHRIEIDVAASSSGPAIRAELELGDLDDFRPLAVSGELIGGSMFTYKTAYRVGGTVEVGGRRFDFDPTRDVAILDEHRSWFPYRTEWTWGTFAARSDGDVVGANLARHRAPAGAVGESCLWAPGQLVTLPSAELIREGDEDLAPWRMTAPDGAVDLRFEPVHRHPVRHRLGVFEVDYSMWYGRYSGSITVADRRYEVDRAHGVCEHMRGRM